MAKYACRLRHRSVIFTFFACFLLFAAISPAFGRGNQENDLARADELIKNKLYDEAILVLTDFARRYPDHFYETQSRLSQIYEIQDEFNRLADQLIDILLNDPGNNERILALTLRLYELEHENSPLIVNFVARTREIAQFNVNRILLREILARGRNFLNAGDSAAALHTYAEGMSFMRDEFFSAGHGVNIENDVRRETERINSMIAAFQQTSTQLGTISAEYTRAINAGELNRIPEITNRLIPAMDRFIVLKQTLYTSIDTFDRILNEIREMNPAIIDRNHLSFVSVVIHGRAVGSLQGASDDFERQYIQEGMLGAFNVYWKNSIGSVLNAISSHAERGKNASITALNAGNYRLAASSLDRMENFFNLTPLFFDKTRQLYAGGNPQTINLFGNDILYTDIPSYIDLLALNEANNFLLQASNIGVQQNFDRTSLVRWEEGRINTDVALRNEQQTRNNIRETQLLIETLRANANQVNTDMNSHHHVTHITDAIRAIDNMHTALQAEERQSIERYFRIAQQSLENILAERRTQLETGINLLEGERHLGEDGVETVFRFPTEAYQELSTMVAESAVILEMEESFFTTALTQEEALASVDYHAVISELTNIHTQGIVLSETARNRSGQAEALRQEGDRLFRDAQAAFQRSDYEAARTLIQRASDRYSESLEIQESPSLRQMRDSQLYSLGQAIAAAENELIIAEVRSLVNSARNAYYNGNFQQAESSLIRARNRWSITSPDENDEVMHWLSIVRTALSATSVRVIPPTAPLFPEMSQLLSQAQRNYEEGVRHVNAGQRALGLAMFDEARQLTREVKLMFPLNQEAGLLDLRIEQFIDPTAFNAAFEQRMRTAIAGTRNRSMEAFADLQNLAEINPRYPNIRAILTQAEIDIGIRPPPPNPADIARSNELTASAGRIINNNQTAQFEVAHTQLNEAIRLNPNNTEASQLRDRLLGRRNVPGNVVLSSQDEADYQRALREFQAGNNLVAFALVERLMLNPSNRNITKLIELQRRIQAIL
jgi:tetratricopeptide (TPR) repeat protein